MSAEQLEKDLEILAIEEEEEKNVSELDGSDQVDPSDVEGLLHTCRGIVFRRLGRTPEDEGSFADELSRLQELE